MARGGYGRGAGIPLGERVRAGHEPAVDAVPAAEQSALSALSPARHCWVAAPVDGGQPRAGLLLEWRHDDEAGWIGRVVYVALLRPGRWASVEEWIPAALLTASPPTT